MSLSRRTLLKSGLYLSWVAARGGRLYAQPADSIRNFMRPNDVSQPSSPEWMKDLIIYEIATKGFTSPHGPESGTFRSLQGKLGYLQDTGITGIWLTGYSLCDPDHFYNIWTQYAVIEPGKLDPSLGTEEEFRSLIQAAHEHGIKVFLDVITHGLMENSPVVKAHPDWFRGSSWGMADFDWSGGHVDLDDWWVNIYSEFVTRYGVDGFRLDVTIFRPDLWERIRQNAAKAGHAIVIWEEANAVLPGVTDFTQSENALMDTESGVMNKILVEDLPGFYDRKFGKAGDYSVEIRYEDGTIVKGSTKGETDIQVSLAGLSLDKAGRRSGEWLPQPDGLPDVKLVVKNAPGKALADVIIRNDTGDQWSLVGDRRLFLDIFHSSGPLRMNAIQDIYIATMSWGVSIELSCHDDGWESFPERSPYVAQGSRALFGYSVMFSPMIPIFFSGEEFDATFHALPKLSTNLYGGKNPGKGKWLYGAQLEWDELSRKPQRDMLDDVTKMIRIRRENKSIFSIAAPGRYPNLSGLPHQSNIKVPVPYIRWDDHAAIVVAANRDKTSDAHVELNIDLKRTGFDGRKSYIVEDLWSGLPRQTMSGDELAKFKCKVLPDGTSRGGLALFKIYPAGVNG